jgi:hypothetical protein
MNAPQAQASRWTNLDADRLYRDLVYPRAQASSGGTAAWDIVALPGEAPRTPLQTGDLLVRVWLGKPGLGHVAVVTDPVLISYDHLAAAGGAERGGPGFYATVTDDGPVPHTRAERFARLILDTRAEMPPGQLLLRPPPYEPPALDVDASVEEEHAEDNLGTEVSESPPGGVSHFTDPGADDDDSETDTESPTRVPVDIAAAVPPFDAAERANVLEPLLTPTESAAAVAWSTRMHPATSGVTFADISGALANYVDAPAVQAAIVRRNTLDPAHPIDATDTHAAPVIMECLHQFQRKCYLDPRQHDGKAGESTLDSLGLIVRTGPGMRGARRGHAGAQQRLNERDRKVKAATANEFSAANWFDLITNPSVFGWTTKSGTGLHVVLVRKLRQAERYLLTLPALRGMTPARLGSALGLTEQHGGARPDDASTNVHSFGLAIDISYKANPWVRRDSSWRALKRAASLISGTNLTARTAGDYLSALGTDPARSTGQVWDELNQRNAELIEYLGLQDATLRATLINRPQAEATTVVKSGETLDSAVRRWHNGIREDIRELGGGDFNGHEPPSKGFLTHPRDLATALRDHGCLAWGAVDFGPSVEGSGDMMHFDARVDGVGRVLMVNTNAWVPEAGHHPCAPVPAPQAGKEEEAEQTLPTIPVTPVRDLLRELKARNMPVAHGHAILVLERLEELRKVVAGKIKDRAAVIAAVDGFLQAIDAHPLSAAHQSLIGVTVGDSIAARLVVNGFTGEADRILGHFHSPKSEYGPWYRGTRMSFIAKGSGYFPDASAMEGGFRDRLGQPLHTLQDFRAGQAPFVSAAMDADNGPPYGTRLSIDEFPGVVFRVVDTGAAFTGKGLSRIDICTANEKASLDPTINGLLHLNFAIPLPAPQTRPHETTEESALGFSSDDDSDDAEAEAPSACPPRRLPGEITRSRAPGGILPIDVIEGAQSLTIHDFAVGSDALPRGVTAAPGWQRVISQLAGDPTSLVGVTGFTDCVGADAENASLRKRRALGIVAAMPPLVQRRVIPGFPTTTDFLDVNSTVEGRARNRAVTLKLALDNSDEPAISKASNLDEFLYLIRVLERKLKLTTPADAPKVLSVLRQIYYGSASWSSFRNAMWDNVIRKRPWLPTTDPTPLLGSKLVATFKVTLSVEGVDPGHVLTGLDAMMAPGFVAIPPPAAYQDVPNEAWATWAGDLASAAADWVADRFWNTLKGTGDLASYIHDLAADDDLTGDVDAFALRAGLNGSAGPGQLTSVVRLSGRLSSMLLDYYRVAASPLGQARERRMRNFISAHGGSIVGGHLQGRAQLEATLRPSVTYMARLFFAADLQKPKRSGQPPKPWPRLDVYRELESASDSVTRHFIEWLFTRAVAEPGP